MAQVQASLADHGTAWLAKHQTAGRGQRGKSWKDAPGENLAISIAVVPPGLQIAQQFYLSMLVALACHDFFLVHAPQYTCIKWPNDLYWKDRKAGGILIENVLQGAEWKFAIIGIGININQVSFDPSLPNPVSLKQLTGKTFDIVNLAKQLCGCLEARWRQLAEGNLAQILQDYNQRLYKSNELVRLKKDNAVIEAKVLGVNEQGELLIYTGSVTAIPFGSVEWILS